MYSVYIHTFPNGKKYVGVTSRKPYLRWGANGCNYRNSLFLYNAIQKYGWDNIKHEIIAENLSVEEASKLEIELISKYKTSEKKYGYNISLGGVGNLGIMSDSTKEKLRGRKLPDYVTQKASEAKFHAVKNMQTGVVYPSIKAACEDSGLNRSTIIRHCNGTLKKQKWKYAKGVKKETDIIKKLMLIY